MLLEVFDRSQILVVWPNLTLKSTVTKSAYASQVHFQEVLVACKLARVSDPLKTYQIEASFGVLE
jgi:hypothetical protein